MTKDHMQPKSHADYLQFDRSTSEGRRALLEQLSDDFIRFWEGFESGLRDPRAVQRQRIDCAVAHNVFAQTFLDTAENTGAPITRSEVKAFGQLAVLVMQACPFLAQARLGHVFAALDDVRAARDQRRGVSLSVQAAPIPPQAVDAVDEEITDVVHLDDDGNEIAEKDEERPHRPARR